jgi:SSS family solute:Na+ symporter
MSILDLAILLGYVGVVLLLGWRMTRGTATLADFAVAGRDRPWWLVMLSIVATETSTVTFLSIPGFAYSRDLTWLQLGIGFALGRVAVALLLLPRYFEGELLTAYELLGRRFGLATQRACSALFLITRTLADGLRLFLTAIVLEELAGIPLWSAVVALGAVTTAYTFSGGMRAVLWADFLQFFVYIAGGGLALLRLHELIDGGWHHALDLAAADGKLRAISLSLDLSDPYTLAAGVLGGVFVTLGSHGVDQMLVQRYLCARSVRAAGTALVVSGLVVLAQFALFLGVGLGLHAFFLQTPPALPIDRPDRAFAHFIVAWMPSGMLGLLLGSVLSAAMSTLSSSLNSSAVSATKDLFGPLLHPGASPSELLRLSRRMTLVFAALQVGVGVAGQWLTESVVASVLAVASFTLGILLGAFFLAIFAPRAREADALAGMAGGFAIMSTLAFGTSLAWPWFALVGSTLTLAAGLASSSLRSRGETGPARA